jgi:hypothetical protein
MFRQYAVMKAPPQRHLEVVGSLFVPLYSAGAIDHVLTRRWDAVYFASRAYFTDYPVGVGLVSLLFLGIVLALLLSCRAPSARDVLS